jgi:hypothetical protein
MNRMAKTRVEKIKQPRAKLRSLFLEIVMVYLTSSTQYTLYKRKCKAAVLPPCIYPRRGIRRAMRRLKEEKRGTIGDF